MGGGGSSPHDVSPGSRIGALLPSCSVFARFERCDEAGAADEAFSAPEEPPPPADSLASFFSAGGALVRSFFSSSSGSSFLGRSPRWRVLMRSEGGLRGNIATNK